MSELKSAKLWEKILFEIEKKISKLAFNNWIKVLLPVSLSEDTLTVKTHQSFIKDWVEENYKQDIEKILFEITEKNIFLHIINLENEENIEDDKVEIPVKNKIEEQKNKDLSPEKLNSTLNNKYTFESFVIGNSNRFAHAASLAVSEVPGKTYNPLFIYGGVGLGKTHLMHAIGQKIKENNSKSNILYISSEKFTNELINSIRDGSTEKFRQKYRNIDCLLIDDIQFLAKKEHTQEEFFHTFNTLYDANKQIVISSDRTPKEIPTLESRLISRFEWGLVADVQPPDIETRIAILRKKILNENIDIDNEILFFIASKIENNIRELEGALLKVIAYSSLGNIPITMNSAKEALKNIIDIKNDKNISIETIQEIICEYYKIKKEELLAKKRTKNIVYPRQIAMYLCRELTDESLPRIGEMFGGRDHTTVIHAVEKISKALEKDSELNNDIKYFINNLKS